MGENGGGEEKLIAVARHIAKTLGDSETMTDDILHIFSSFDGRFSREKLSSNSSELPHNPPSAVDCISTLRRQISPFLTSERSLWSDPSLSSAFLDALDDLIATIRDLAPLNDPNTNNNNNNSLSTALDIADDLLHQSLFRLQDEFRSLIQRTHSYDYPHDDDDDDDDDDPDDEDDDSSINNNDNNNIIPVAYPVTDFNIIIDALPPSTITDLHEIVKRMDAADYGRECSHVYSACRRDFLEESLSRLGLQHKQLSTEEIHKLPWSDLEDEIERWCKATLLSLRVLFPSERRLCDRVFFAFPVIADFSFMEVCRSSVIQLLKFADAVAISTRSPERLFKVLDIYDTLRDLMPDFDLLFSDHYCLLLRNEALSIWKRVGESIRGIFMELENLIRRDPAKSPVPGGGLHPITRYVMNYLRAACKSQQTLEQVFEEERERGLATATGSLSLQMVCIMELLESNLDAKSKIYRDPALSSVFMMNNGRYIVQKVKDSELGVLLGDGWIRKHNAKVRQSQSNYLRSSWNKVIGILKLDNSSYNANMKERLKIFNSQFEDMLKIHSSWVIFDDSLREELNVSVTAILLPAYRTFIGRFHSSAEAGRNPERHIKFGVEDVQARIGSELFRGNSGRR